MNVTYSNYREKLGEAIRIGRDEKGLSREALAAKIDGVCTKTVERVEKANYSKDIGLQTIQNICAELGISIKMTLGGA